MADSDVADDGTTGEPDGTVDAYDPWYWFTYDDGWRIVATFRAADDDPKEVFVHHSAGLGAGLGGRGGSSYIDSVILRDRDAGTGWAEQADSTREERVYYCQNWRADVVALLSDSGKMLEWTKYSAYGVPFALPAGDIDSDGDFDATDVAGITGTYDVRKDTNLDGSINFYDVQHAIGITGSFQTLGRGLLTSPAIDNRRGYAGYESDPTFAGANGGGAAARTIYHVRHRVYDADVGRWTRRDPLGYSDGMSLYAYVQGLAIIGADPWGLLTCAGGCKNPVSRPSTPGRRRGGPIVCSGKACGYPPDSERWPGGRGPGIGPRCPQGTVPATGKSTCATVCQGVCRSQVGIAGQVCYATCMLGCGGSQLIDQVSAAAKVIGPAACKVLDTLTNNDRYVCFSGLVAIADLVPGTGPVVEGLDCLFNFVSVLQAACAGSSLGWVYGALAVMDCMPLIGCPISGLLAGGGLLTLNPGEVLAGALACIVEQIAYDVASWLMQNILRNGSYLPHDQMKACCRSLGLPC